MNLTTISFHLRKKFNNRILKEKTYNTYAEAAEKCKRSLYEDNAIVQLLADKAKDNSFTTPTSKPLNPGCLALADVISRHLIEYPGKLVTVIDFGGGNGDYYYNTRRVLNNDVQLKWVVVETPAMAQVLQPYQTKELFFADTIEKAMSLVDNKLDILFTSGTLQVMPDPYQTIEMLCNTNSNYMVFHRQSLSLENFDIISIQTSLLSWHGSTKLPENFKEKIIKYPYTSIQRSRFEDQLKNTKYQLLYTFDEGTGVKRVNNYNVKGTSYIYKRS
ncbi:MAG: methyltransferase, TIGR04325 family [Chitinophaga sp.]|uniref:methyltransferase, TIGR04325 family n=1 Tax=Chitinophaga sp. TaxID=1869181 RepID=UPI0025BEAC6A|nr:methyltransferase, TIGR04325 family [Chitinophaga sp.]MBV8255592.1 methyltransferase, TIGR04325 family [Chitinophaga sp.]